MNWKRHLFCWVYALVLYFTWRNTIKLYFDKCEIISFSKSYLNQILFYLYVYRICSEGGVFPCIIAITLFLLFVCSPVIVYVYVCSLNVRGSFSEIRTNLLVKIYLHFNMPLCFKITCIKYIYIVYNIILFDFFIM